MKSNRIQNNPTIPKTFQADYDEHQFEGIGNI